MVHTREQQALLQLVREVSRRQIAPRAQHHQDAGSFPAELFALLAELDLLGLPFATDDGGGGQPLTLVCQVLSELSRAFLAVGLGASVHLLATRLVAEHAAPEVRREVLPRLVAGEWLATCQLAEPDDAPGAVPTPAARDGDSYVLNGPTPPVSHAGQADCYVLFCSAARADASTALLVPADTPGLSTPKPDDGSRTATLWCRELRVPVSHRLGDDGDGRAIALDALDVGRIGVAACAVGLARAALHAAISGVRSHRALGGTPVAIERYALRVADLTAATEAADALCQRAASAADAGDPVTALSSMAGVVATRTAVDVATAAAEICDDAGNPSEYPVRRYRRDAQALDGVDGDVGWQRRLLARDIIGGPDDER